MAVRICGQCLRPRSMRLFRLAETPPAINWLQTVGSLEWQHPPWIFRGKHADLIQLPKLVLSEYEFSRREIILKLVEPFRANDDRGYYRLGQEPCDRETCRTTAMCFRDRSHHVENLPGPFFVHDRKIVASAARICRLLVHPAVLAGQQATGKRTPYEQADLFGLQQGNDFPFEIAAGDRVISLKRVESGQVPELADAEGFGEFPCLPVGAADVADLSLLHQGVESAKRLFNRGHGIVAMNLVQIDVVGLQAAETGLHTVHNVAARSPDVIPPRADAAIDLCRDHNILPRDVEVFQRLPENLFALALRVIVRRIKEVDAAVNRRLDQFIGPGLVNGADRPEESSAVPERHGSEAEFRNQQTCIAERCVFHVVFRSMSPKFPCRKARHDRPALSLARYCPWLTSTSRHAAESFGRFSLRQARTVKSP